MKTALYTYVSVTEVHGRRTDSQTARRADRQIENTQVFRQPDNQEDRRTKSQKGRRQTGRQTKSHIFRQPYRQTDIQQTSKQPDRQTNSQKVNQENRQTGE